MFDLLLQPAADGDDVARAKLQELRVGMALDEVAARPIYAALGFEA